MKAVVASVCKTTIAAVFTLILVTIIGQEVIELWAWLKQDVIPPGYGLGLVFALAVTGLRLL